MPSVKRLWGSSGDTRALMTSTPFPRFGSGPGFDNVVITDGGVSVPSLCDIKSWGYDAIAQISNSLAGQLVSRSSAARFVYVADLHSADIDPELRTAIDQLIARNPMEAVLVRGRPTSATMIVGFEPRGWRVTFSAPAVRFVPGDRATCAITWRFSLAVDLAETDESYRERVDLSDLPRWIDRSEVVDTDPLTSSLEMQSGTVELTDTIQLDVDAPRYEVLAYADARTSSAAIRASGSGIELVRSAVLDPAVEQLKSGLRRVELTPEVSLGGGLAATERLVGLGAFEVHPVTVQGNARGATVLSLCMLVGGGRIGRPRAVRAFTGSKNFAYVTSESIISAAAIKNWARSSVRKVVRTETPIPMERDGVLTTGTATVQMEFRDLSSVPLVVGVDDAPDAIRMNLRYTVQLLRVLDPDGVEIPDLGELGRPETVDAAIDVRPFTMIGDETSTPAQRFVIQLARDVLYAALRPTLPAWRLYEFEGQVSDAAGAMLTRGHLR